MFNLREHKSSVNACEVTYSKSDDTTVRETSGTSAYGMNGYMFFVAPREWLDGKYLRFRWLGYHSYPRANAISFLIYDGSYDRSSMIDFPNQAPMVAKGNGLLYSLYKSASFPWETQDILVDVSGGSEEFVTIFFQIYDGYSAQYFYIDLDWLEINSGSNGAGNLFREHFTDSVHMEVTGTQNDYGYISEGLAEPKNVYVTFYNTSNGKFLYNGILINNGSMIPFLNESILSLVGAPDVNKTWIRFQIDSINHTINNYNFTVLSNSTIWCYFGSPVGDGGELTRTQYLLIAIVFVIMIVIVIPILLKKRR